MSVRVHTTTVGNCAVQVLDNQAINELFGYDESPLPDGKSLVIEDGGNCEAWILMADTDDDILDFARTVRLGGDRSYCDPQDVTVIRLFKDGDKWQVDGEDRFGRCTEYCATLDMLPEAIGTIPEFIAEYKLFEPKLDPPTPLRIATAGELRAALDGLADDSIVMFDGQVYVGPGSAYNEDEKED